MAPPSDKPQNLEFMECYYYPKKCVPCERARRDAWQVIHHIPTRQNFYANFEEEVDKNLVHTSLETSHPGPAPWYIAVELLPTRGDSNTLWLPTEPLSLENSVVSDDQQVQHSLEEGQVVGGGPLEDSMIEESSMAGLRIEENSVVEEKDSMVEENSREDSRIEENAAVKENSAVEENLAIEENLRAKGNTRVEEKPMVEWSPAVEKESNSRRQGSDTGSEEWENLANWSPLPSIRKAQEEKEEFIRNVISALEEAQVQVARSLQRMSMALPADPTQYKIALSYFDKQRQAIRKKMEDAKIELQQILSDRLL
ncbi:hypothetical protein PtB15_8B819 [Puccinia triticina]|nr:hypothetical protein PtB15_8B819 [Puccinia triticina]